jgi:AraC-like DNA-binding protein
VKQGEAGTFLRFRNKEERPRFAWFADATVPAMTAALELPPPNPRTRVVRSAPDESAWELWEREPLPALRGIVSGLWAGGTAAGTARHRALPNGEVWLMLHIGPAQRAIESDGKSVSRLLDAGFVAGLQQRPYTIESMNRDTYVVSARIRPECVAALFPRATPSELVGQVESASDLLGREAADALCGRMREARNLGEALDRFERWLLEQARPERLPRDVTRAASARIARASGKLRVGALSRELGISTRRMNELFQSEVGVRAKRVAKIARFRGALGRLHAERPRELAGLALDAGYYDESHLYRDFRELALLTPSEYLEALGDGIDGPDVIGS